MSAKLPPHLSVLNKSDLESMCVNCGLCCYAAVPVAKGVNALVPELRCKYLVQKGTDGETCCSTYDTRFEKAGAWCLPLADAIQKGVFPEACPYVQDMKGYVGKVVLDDKTYAMVRPQIHDKVVSKGMPDWAEPNAWSEFVGDKK
jgi:uncharacterized cysteine cluster protein YcgN (CxxCxxCC family)